MVCEYNANTGPHNPRCTNSAKLEVVVLNPRDKINPSRNLCMWHAAKYLEMNVIGFKWEATIKPLR